MRTIKHLLAEHRKLKLPEFPEDDNFSELVEELIEIDAYYVGLIYSLSEGGKVQLNSFFLDVLKNKLKNFEHSVDRKIYKDCQNYVSSLDRLVSFALNRDN